MNYPKDPKLSELGRKLVACQFSTPLSARALLRNVAIETNSDICKLRGVKRAPGDKQLTYLIQSYVGGSLRSFGSVILDVFHACRLADMLTFRFGHLRLMYLRPTTDADYNYTAEQAAADYANEPHISAIVDQIFSHLLNIDAILDPNNLPIAPVPPSRKTKLKVTPRQQTQLDRIEDMLKLLVQRGTYLADRSTPITEPTTVL